MTPETIKQIVEAANAAPSGDNCQPWTFSWDGKTLSIHIDANRAEAFMDVKQVASWISLGMVVTNIRVAAAHHALIIDVKLTIDFPRTSKVAEITFSPGKSALGDLYPTIQARCTNRKPYDTTSLLPSVKNEFEKTLSRFPGLSLSIIDNDAHRKTLAYSCAEFDDFVYHHKEIHAGLFRWIRWNDHECEATRDGMPLPTLEILGSDAAVMKWIANFRFAKLLSAMRFTKLVIAKAFQTYKRSSAFILISAEGRQTNDFVKGGELWEELWLKGTANGLSVQPMSGWLFLLHRIRMANGTGLSDVEQKKVTRFVEKCRPFLPELEKRTPVMLFRIGRGDAPSARALRLPLEKVLKI